MALAHRLFDALEEAGIRYCCWKSIDKLEDGLSGGTDLDVLVAREDVAPFYELASRFGFCLFESEPWRRYPGLADLIAYDRGLRRLIHLHVHHQLLLGRGRVKEVHLPLESLYLASPCIAHGIRVPTPELEFVVWVIRIALKISHRDRIRGVVRRDPLAVFARHLSEYRSLRPRVDAARLDALLGDEALRFVPREVALGVLADLRHLSPTACRAIRRNLAPYCRYQPLERLVVTTVRRYGPLLDRWRGRAAGKTSRTGGLIVAIVGPDGAGKSTLCRAAARTLAGLVATHTAYMGTGGRHARAWRLRGFAAITALPFRILRRTCRALGLGAVAKALTLLYEALSAAVTARDKVWRFRRAWAAASHGQIVLSDRYPLFAGYGDGEAIEPSVRPTSRLLAALRRFETAQLRRISPPDLIVFLDVQATVARERKPDETEPMETIDRKRAAFWEFFERNRSIPLLLYLPQDSPPEERAHLVVDAIFSALEGAKTRPSWPPTKMELEAARP